MKKGMGTVVGVSAIVEVMCICPKCDHEEVFEDYGMSMQGDAFASSTSEHTCSQCGFTYYHEEEYYFDDEGNEIDENEYYRLEEEEEE